MPDSVPITKAAERTHSIEAPIARMRADHDDQAVKRAAIRRRASGLTLQQGACRTWTTLHAKLDEFIADLEEQMRLENETLFPQFESGGTVHV